MTVMGNSIVLHAVCSGPLAAWVRATAKREKKTVSKWLIRRITLAKRSYENQAKLLAAERKLAKDSAKPTAKKKAKRTTKKIKIQATEAESV